jgi:ATP-binding cassette subfamily G (WHITE) protein 2 (SNQ2)
MQTVSGADYIRAVYGFEAGHIWRNVGILWAFFAIYVLLVFLGSSLMVRETSDSTQKIFKRGAKVTAVPAEALIQNADDHATDDSLPDPDKLPTFTFQDVRYMVQVAGQDKALLVGTAVFME